LMMRQKEAERDMEQLQVQLAMDENAKMAKQTQKRLVNLEKTNMENNDHICKLEEENKRLQQQATQEDIDRVREANRVLLHEVSSRDGEVKALRMDCLSARTS
jgi:LAS superfamily LD-carboxypeptidase LdcB